MRTQAEVDEVLALVGQGLNACEISRRTGIPRSTVRWWRDGRVPGASAGLDGVERCDSCGHPRHEFDEFDPETYAYLLGMYLGDGHIVASRRGVYRLSIYCDASYPRIIDEVSNALLAFSPSQHVGVEHFPSGDRGNVCRVGAYSKVWPCLLPQHGPGRKHTRSIFLVSWQRRLVDAAPESLLRGLIHSDGCRSMNRVRERNCTYEYPRYTFSNLSRDIRGIFCDALDQLEIPWRRMNAMNISVARREGVARLDKFVGPKA